MRREINVTEFSSIVREFASYKSAIQGCSPKTVDQYLLDLRTFFRYLEARSDPQVLSDPEAFAKITVDHVDLDMIRRITTEDIMDFLLYVDTDRANKSAAKARKLSAIKGLFKYLVVKRGYLDVNPTANIETPKHKPSLPKFLTFEESIQLLQAIANHKDSPHRVRNYAIVTLFLNCGMRLSELVGINLGDVDPKLRSLRVTGKGSKERVIYLNDACQSALGAYLMQRTQGDMAKTTDKAVFLSQRMHRISVQMVQTMVYQYLEMAGLGPRKLSVHKLRHTAATLMYQSGDVDIRVLKDILGHEQLNTTQIYTHVSDAGMEYAMRHNPLANVSIPNLHDDTDEDT